MKRVLIVEDQRFARDHLESCVLKNENYYLVKSVTSAIYAEEICKSSVIDLIIMDVCTEFDADGIEAAKKAGLICIAKRDDRFNYDQSKADYFIDDHDEIKDILENLK